MLPDDPVDSINQPAIAGLEPEAYLWVIIYYLLVISYLEVFRNN
ncbi:hypothetical protein [Planktothricoides raciborskii]|nr:hypothetical protein [Planktothricoides raciborskii]